MITPVQLKIEVAKARETYPWIGYVERIRGLPPWTLFALGSRESNMRNIIGDFGHGVGIWQRDDRAWATLPTPDGPLSTPSGKKWYLLHPRRQSEDAAALLLRLNREFSSWETTFCAYNAGAGAIRGRLSRGEDPNLATTGENYGRDVLWRRGVLRSIFGKSV